MAYTSVRVRTDVLSWFNQFKHQLASQDKTFVKPEGKNTVQKMRKTRKSNAEGDGLSSRRQIP